MKNEPRTAQRFSEVGCFPHFLGQFPEAMSWVRAVQAGLHHGYGWAEVVTSLSHLSQGLLQAGTKTQAAPDFCQVAPIVSPSPTGVSRLGVSRQIWWGKFGEVSLPSLSPLGKPLVNQSSAADPNARLQNLSLCHPIWISASLNPLLPKR